MKEIKIGKHNLKIYDSIEELPIVRHHKFNKLMLIDAHIGSDITDFDTHIERILQYLKLNKTDLARKELLNIRQNVYFIQAEVSPKYLAFAVLIHSIDGEAIDDLSDEALKKVVSILSDASVGEMGNAIEEVKKKLDVELQTYFPALFDSALLKEYYDKLKKRTLLLIKHLTEGLTDGESDELDAITTETILFSEPQIFFGPDSLEIQQDKQFENACLMISQSTGSNAKNFTVLEYYNALFFIKEQTKAPVKKAGKR